MLRAPKIVFLFFCLFSFISCNGQVKPDASNDVNEASKEQSTLFESVEFNPQIGAYIVDIFEDKESNLWFGTIAKGVARYDGKSLIYFDTDDGLAGNAVVNIMEDNAGNLWFATHSGLSKYANGMFTSYISKDGPCHDRMSNLLIDEKGNFWVGSWAGVCLFNGTTFTNFPLPTPDVELLEYQATMDWITEIMEDDEGNIWFGRDGYGACKYDPLSGNFTHFTKKDGLASNNVQSIIQDKNGNIWFGSRVTEKDHPDPTKRAGDGGLSRYDGQVITQFPELEGLSENDVYLVTEDRTGDLWICATGIGLYRYNGTSFDIYKETDRMDLTARFGVQSLLKDKEGTIWLGFSGGLFRLEESSIINITQNGPWN